MTQKKSVKLYPERIKVNPVFNQDGFFNFVQSFEKLRLEQSVDIIVIYDSEPEGFFIDIVEYLSRYYRYVAYRRREEDIEVELKIFNKRLFH